MTHIVGSTRARETIPVRCEKGRTITAIELRIREDLEVRRVAITENDAVRTMWFGTEFAGVVGDRESVAKVQVEVRRIGDDLVDRSDERRVWNERQISVESLHEVE